MFSFLLIGLLLGFISPARASHIMGGQLTYRWVSGSTYEVTLVLYGDCTGIYLPTGSVTILAQNNGCNSTAVTAALVPLGTSQTIQPYCSSVQQQVICSAASTRPLTYFQSYRGTISLPPAANWVLSYEDAARPGSANVAGQPNFRFEATLNNQLAAGGAVQTVANTSPLFNLTTSSLIPWNRSSTISNAGFDADGDSLAYSLVDPLEMCNRTIAYYQSITRLAGVPQPGCTYAVAAGSPTTYSATYPMVTAYDTTGSCPQRLLTPKPFLFDAATGTITVTPSRHPAFAPIQSAYRYMVVVMVTEYRRLPGSNRRYRVGSVRRDLIMTVYDCGANQLPRFAPTVVVNQRSQSRTQPLGQEIQALAGESLTVDLTATDSDAGQFVLLSVAGTPVPGISLYQTLNGQSRLTFVVPPSLPEGLYHVSVAALDDACPVKGVQGQTLAFRVVNTALATRAAQALAVAAFPNPFTEQVKFQLATPGVQTLTVCDHLGRTVATVRSQPNGTVVWQPAATLPAGLYLARSADGRQSVRLLRSAAQ
ncbi:hypothetical protein GCM10028824_26010 [Hymenobacter segetis]